MRAEDFDTFFKAIHGKAPFPWQSDLVREVIKTGWPDALDLPTGAGKTAVLEVAVFALAHELQELGSKRRHPLRMVFVVDRRTIVDQAAERAKKICEALARADAGILAEVKQALETAGISEKGRGLPSLNWTALRGGMPLDDGWARDPSAPLIVLSTVDQVGSRLLFRGYGVSSRMRPVHAGLLGNDCIYFLDEVHLSQPFVRTLRTATSRFGPKQGTGIPRRLSILELSATRTSSSGRSFTLGPEDWQHPVLGKRLRAEKTVTRMNLGDARKRTKWVVETAGQAAKDGKAVCVVVNTVNGAVSLYRSWQPEADYDIILVTGRMRGLDRKGLEERLNVVRSGRGSLERGIVVISTQCLEAGADLDFDVLLTECAPIDALIQRFGRLNRLGEREDCQGYIFGPPDKKANVYGAAAENTWEWLKEREQWNFGVQALSDLEIPKELFSQPTGSPLLLEKHMRCWVQTSPEPEPSPVPAYWLHGWTKPSEEVSIVWRADLDGREELSVMPTQGEALNVPLASARRWLLGQTGSLLTDVEALADEPSGKDDQGPTVEPSAVAFRLDEEGKLSPLRKMRLKPGDVIIVASTKGGLTAGSWDPEAQSPVSDLADEAHFARKGQRVLRLDTNCHPKLALLRWPEEELRDAISEKKATADETEEHGEHRLRDSAEAIVRSWIGALTDEMLGRVAAAGRAGYLRDTLKAIRDAPERFEFVTRNLRGGLTLEIAVWGKNVEHVAASSYTTEGDSGTFTGRKILLGEHLAGVADYAGRLAEKLGISEERASELRLAGDLHDAGKADLRMQTMMHGGDEFAMYASEGLLAKSSIRTDRTRRLQRGDYPRGYRHEVLSLAMLETSPPEELVKAEDPELVKFLVSSHHGFCRPLAPTRKESGDAVEVEYDHPRLGPLKASTMHGLERGSSGTVERFDALIDNYGIYGVAYLEAILRLADHLRSAAEVSATEVEQ
jgi:CRISPR-associated endonuclease/helicase Cas3